MWCCCIIGFSIYPSLTRLFFLFEHLEGEARDEIKYWLFYRVYGCSESDIALQEAFFSRRQQEGATLREFSFALMGLLERMRQRAPGGPQDAEDLWRDQFIDLDMLDIRAEAIL